MFAAAGEVVDTLFCSVDVGVVVSDSIVVLFSTSVASFGVDAVVEVSWTRPEVRKRYVVSSVFLKSAVEVAMGSEK